MIRNRYVDFAHKAANVWKLTVAKLELNAYSTNGRIPWIWTFWKPTVDFACYSSKLEEFDTLTLTRPLIIIKQRDDTKYYIQSTAFLILILPNQKFRLGIHFNLLSRFYLGTVCCFLKCYEICTYLDIPITRVITISELP